MSSPSSSITNSQPVPPACFEPMSKHVRRRHDPLRRNFEDLLGKPSSRISATEQKTLAQKIILIFRSTVGSTEEYVTYWKASIETMRTILRHPGTPSESIDDTAQEFIRAVPIYLMLKCSSNIAPLIPDETKRFRYVEQFLTLELAPKDSDLFCFRSMIRTLICNTVHSIACERKNRNRAKLEETLLTIDLSKWEDLKEKEKEELSKNLNKACETPIEIAQWEEFQKGTLRRITRNLLNLCLPSWIEIIVKNTSSHEAAVVLATDFIMKCFLNCEELECLEAKKYKEMIESDVSHAINREKIRNLNLHKGAFSDYP